MFPSDASAFMERLCVIFPCYIDFIVTMVNVYGCTLPSLLQLLLHGLLELIDSQSWLARLAKVARKTRKESCARNEPGIEAGSIALMCRSLFCK